MTTQQAAAAAANPVAAGEVTSLGSPLRLAVDSLRQNKAALAGLVIIVVMLGFSFLGPLFYHTNQISTNLPDSLRPPSAAHPLGTDNEG
jgi:peptide/nickel transport system permease protein